MKNAQTKFRIAGSGEVIDAAPAPSWVEVDDEAAYESLVRLVFRASGESPAVSE
jgi:hypothetical protein